MSALANISHNLAEHTETLLRIFSDEKLDPEMVNRLKDHILLEETENAQKLKEIHSGNPMPMTQKLLDHSFFLQKIIQDDVMPMDLKRELLHHFTEEHEEWGLEAQDHGVDSKPEQKTDNGANSWTVGPMWQQGG